MGRGGADSLFGGAGQDALFGDGGRDLLVGGIGGDRMDGGGGSDIYGLESIDDSPVGPIDVIRFVQGEDRLDLSAIDADLGTRGDQAFTLVEGAFTETAGELRAMVRTRGTLLAGDVDGDGAADFMVLLLGVSGTITEADFFGF